MAVLNYKNIFLLLMMLIVSVSGQATTDDALALPHGAHFIMPSVESIGFSGAFGLRKAAVGRILELEGAKDCFSEEERVQLATFLEAKEPFFTTANYFLFKLIVNNGGLIERHIDLWQRFAFGIVPLPEEVLKEYVVSPEREKSTLSFIFDTAKKAYESGPYRITKDGSVCLCARAA